MPINAKFDHLAIAVRNLEESARVFQEVFGAKMVFTTESEALGVKSAFFVWGDKMITMEQPVRADSTFADFIEKRGEGIHHIGVEVDDIEATIAELEAKGYRVVNKQLIGEQRREALVLPKQFFGILLQMIEWRGSCKYSLEARLELCRHDLHIPGKSSSA
ncbi:MAG: VOC family protein [Chloroflexota bacterium]